MINDEVSRATTLELARAQRERHRDRNGRCRCQDAWPCLASIRLDETIAALTVEPPRLAG